MMLSDPWDLKHEIEKIQQEERYNKKLLKNQNQSSSNFHENHTQDTSSKSALKNFIIQQNHEQQIASEENSFQQPPTKQKSTHLSGKQQDSSGQIQFMEPQQKLKRKKYGNLIVFLETSSFFISIGPNYLFFLFAYLCFTIASIYLTQLVNESLQNIYFKAFNFCFCLLQNLSYLLVAFSDPGIQLPQQDILMSSNQIQQSHYCKKCNALQEQKTRHCRECDICVKDYDHHCPWTSKCIGGGNLKRFYLFVGITPFYIFYYVVTFMICMASLTVGHYSNLNKQSTSTIPKL